MTTVAITTEQQARLQVEVQQELEKREWAEPNDSVMAEYISVLIANGNAKDRVQAEMDDLVGSDFDPQFLDWLFATASDIQRSAPPPRSPVAATTSHSPIAPTGPSHANSAPSSGSGPSGSGGSRLLNNALAPLSESQKRKAEAGDGGVGPRKRLSEGSSSAHSAPSGPRGMGNEGRSLAERMSGRAGPHGGAGPGPGPGRGMQVRGIAGGPGRGQNGVGNGMGGMGIGMGGGMGGNVPMGPRGFQPGFQQGMMAPGFAPGFFPPGQQEMMAQMMMMQANMAQMGEMMAKMVEERDTPAVVAPVPSPSPARPARPPAAPKIPHGTKLGSHSVSPIQPKTASTPGPIPDKPSSKALCRYGVGCSNSRCPYSHPSPAADEKTGMVLSEEACEKGRQCKDPECTKSHVSPAAVLGETAGPSRLLCKYQNCTNPSCPFRHEDADGNPIPPPALTAAKAAKDAKTTAKPIPPPPGPSSDNEDGDGDVEVVMTSRTLMDGPLDDVKPDKPCRYGERCTRPDCKFSHPASRPTPKVRGSYSSSPFGKRPSNGATNGGVGNGGMNISKKFGVAAEKKLDPAAGAFVPEPAGAGDIAEETKVEQEVGVTG